jgi:hypothetical protein
MRHPHTGEPIQALFRRRNGRLMWPILGASPDDEGGEIGGGGGQGGDGGQGGQGGDEHGFPANTAVADMTVEQQLAYHQYHSRKHEQRAKAYRDAAGGKSADEVKQLVDGAESARRNTLTVDERALEDAKNQGRAAALAEVGPKAVRSAFDLLLGDMPEKDRDEHIDTLDLSKFLTDDNEVDTAKVRAHVARIQPAKGQGGQTDWGQGRRGGTSGGGPSGKSVAAVMADRRAAREKQ